MRIAIIVDAGSTKTQWMIAGLESRLRLPFDTEGINASVSADEEISAALSKVRDYIMKANLPKISSIDVFFYGAGVNSDFTKGRIRKVLEEMFPSLIRRMCIGSDILGAAVALFGRDSGIPCILGTGSASAIYDGQHIIHSVPSLGFILGDEAGGAYFGKRLLNSYFKGLLSEEVSALLSKNYDVELTEVIKRVYRSEAPNRYLASFAPFIVQHYELEELKKMVDDGINEFFIRNINRYEEARKYPLGFVGSLAYCFSDAIGEIADKYGYTVSRIIRHPLEDITNFHMSSC